MGLDSSTWSGVDLAALRRALPVTRAPRWLAAGIAPGYAGVAAGFTLAADLAAAPGAANGRLGRLKQRGDHVAARGDLTGLAPLLVGKVDGAPPLVAGMGEHLVPDIKLGDHFRIRCALSSNVYRRMHIAVLAPALGRGR